VSKYGNVIYGGARYGETPNLAYSVEPMSIQVLHFQQVSLSWFNPIGEFSRFRVVRNQNGFPETAEDGVIAYEVSSEDGSNLAGVLEKTTLIDGEENTSSTNYIPITPGRNIYYRVFLYNSQGLWVKAGQVFDIVPTDTDVTRELMDLLPRTLVSDVLSPFGVIPQKTDEVKTELYQFLDGMAFTYEQLLAQIRLLRPYHNVDPANFLTILAESYSVGMAPEENLPVVNQRRLIRDAIRLYSQKGTALGVKNYSQALTGFLTNILSSPNLLLSVQDSTFYKEVGNWQATNATITSTNTMLPNISVDNCVDKVYTLKIDASAAGNITLGYDSPVLSGIPIVAGNHYTYSAQVKRPTGSGSVTPTIAFFDANGTETYTVTGSATAAGNAWKYVTQTVDASQSNIAHANYAGLKLSWSAAGIYYVDMVCLQTGTQIAYDEARLTTVLLRPSKTNFIKNPSFEIDDVTWQYAGITFSQDTDNIAAEGFPRSHSGKFTATGPAWELLNNSQVPVARGTYFNVSAYVYSPDITSLIMTVTVYDADQNILTSISEEKTIGTIWSRIHVGGLTDLETYADTVHVKFTGESSAGDVIYFDMVQAQNTYTPTDYFDGSMPSSVGVVWEGNEHNSNSLYYPGKETKFLRLAQNLKDWMPVNAWWRIATPAGLEYTNLDV
jgi:phage tail-like protein